MRRSRHYLAADLAAHMEGIAAGIRAGTQAPALRPAHVLDLPQASQVKPDGGWSLTRMTPRRGTKLGQGDIEIKDHGQRRSLADTDLRLPSSMRAGLPIVRAIVAADQFASFPRDLPRRRVLSCDYLRELIASQRSPLIPSCPGPALPGPGTEPGTASGSGSRNTAVPGAVTAARCRARAIGSSFLGHELVHLAAKLSHRRGEVRTGTGGDGRRRLRTGRGRFSLPLPCDRTRAPAGAFPWRSTNSRKACSAAAFLSRPSVSPVAST